MPHSPIRDQLVALAAETAGDPTGFLDGLSDVHAAWHMENVRTYGFLLFHHRVVRYFNATVNAQLQPPVTPYTPGDLQGMGIQPFGANLANIDLLAEMATFSRNVESWHNNTHRLLANATQTPLLDPRQNIFFRPFWQLHLYIEDLFRQVLQQYGDLAHPGQFLTLDAVAGHLEASHHGWVPAI